MAPPSKYPLYPREHHRLIKEFVEQYDYSYWIFKLNTYNQIIDNIGDFSGRYGDEYIDDAGTEQYEQSLKSEVVYMFYHTSEALFSLIMSFSESSIPPLEMKRIRINHIRNFVENKLGTNEFDNNEIRELFYFEVQDGSNRISESVDFIEKYMSNIGDLLLENTIYNEYKHGLRLNATSSEFEMSTQEGETILDTEGNSIVYIRTDRLRDDLPVNEDDNRQWGKSAYVTEFFNFDFYNTLCGLNTHLIRHFVEMRKEEIRIQEEEQPDEDGVIRTEAELDLPLYTNFDIRELFEPDLGVSEFTLDFQVGPEVYQTKY